MADKNKLPKDVEEQIQGLASDVYIQIEEKLTQLISNAVKAEIGNAAEQQNKDFSEKEQSLEKNFSEKQQSNAKELEQIKQALAEKTADQEAAKQSFQVELTQTTINFTETIERLEKELNSAKQLQSQEQNDKQSSSLKLEEKLLEAEQKLNDKTQETDGLNGRIMVLTEQEQSLTKQLNDAKDKIQSADKQQSELLTTAKAEVAATAQIQLDELTEKLKQADIEKAQVQTEAQQGANSQIIELEKKISQFQEQVQQEQNGKAEIQQQLSAMQKSVDTEQDKTKQADQRASDYQEKIIKLTEQEDQRVNDYQDKITKLTEQKEQVEQKHLDEIKAINSADEEAKALQKAAQQNIIELEKTIIDLNSKIETEQNDVKLYQQEVTVLNEQLKVAQEGQENILQRFNSNRDKQEIENTKVRETIKYLRDENHQLISDSTDIKSQFVDQISELEHKLTEYRLKFEYAQKQLAN